MLRRNVLEKAVVGEGEMQKRSYPNSFGRHQGTAGYELVQQWDLVGNARRMVGAMVSELARVDPDVPEVLAQLRGA